MWFDTILSKHHHFYDEEEDELVDIQDREINRKELHKLLCGANVKSYKLH